MAFISSNRASGAAILDFQAVILDFQAAILDFRAAMLKHIGAILELYDWLRYKKDLFGFHQKQNQYFLFYLRLNV